MGTPALTKRTRAAWISAFASHTPCCPTPRNAARRPALRAEKHRRNAERWRQRWAAEEAAAAAAAAARAPGAPEGAGAGAGDDDLEAELQGCVPVWVGSPDSDSVDPDTVPCIPPSVADQLHSPEEVQVGRGRAAGGVGQPAMQVAGQSVRRWVWLGLGWVSLAPLVLVLGALR